MAELKNCARCGEIFAMNIRDVCPKCYRKEEEDYQTVYRFLTKKQNREAKVDEIVEGTGVEESTIIKFIKQNRLRSSMFPNLSYGCEKCDTLISEGRLCDKCKTFIQKEVVRHDEEEKKKQEKDKADPVYFTMNKKKF